MATFGTPRKFDRPNHFYRAFSQQRRILCDDSGRAVCTHKLSRACSAAAVWNEGKGLGEILKSVASRRIGVEKVCADPIGVGHLMPIGNAHALNSLLQDLTRPGYLSSHFDRLHR